MRWWRSRRYPSNYHGRSCRLPLQPRCPLSRPPRLPGRAEREIDHADVISAFKRNGALNGGNYAGFVAVSVCIQNAQINEAHVRSNASKSAGEDQTGGILSAGADDACYVGSVSINVRRGGVAHHKAFAMQDTRVCAVGAGEVVLESDAAVDDGNSYAGSVPAQRPGRIGIHSRRGEIEKTLDHSVRRNVLDVRHGLECGQHTGGNTHFNSVNGVECFLGLTIRAELLQVVLGGERFELYDDVYGRR